MVFAGLCDDWICRVRRVDDCGVPKQVVGTGVTGIGEVSYFHVRVVTVPDQLEVDPRSPMVFFPTR